jgi:SurA N-terminal domain
MKLVAAAIIAAMMVVVCTPSVARAEVIDRVLAVVGGQLITLTDVTAARDLRLVPPETTADATRTILSKLIDRELVLAEVERYAPPEPTAEAVDTEVRRVRARFDSAEAFEAALVRSGIDEKHLRETLRQDLRIRAYLDQRFAAPSDRRDAALEEWMNGLRRRGDVIDLYLPAR